VDSGSRNLPFAEGASSVKLKYRVWDEAVGPWQHAERRVLQGADIRHCPAAWGLRL